MPFDTGILNNLIKMIKKSYKKFKCEIKVGKVKTLIHFKIVVKQRNNLA